MRATRFELPGGNWVGDLPAWRQANSQDNREQLARLRRQLHLARQRELTPRQQLVVTLYYDRHHTMADIARQLGVHQSTVSRTLCRARARLYRVLRYGV